MCLIAVDGGWSEWGQFSECSETCGGGYTTRTRQCNDPSPINGGEDCPGETFETAVCNKEINCKSDKAKQRSTHQMHPYLGPVHGSWSKWSDWSTCTRVCGTGNQTRERSCTNPAPAYNGRDCWGKNSTTRQCNTDSCPGNYIIIQITKKDRRGVLFM